MQDKIETLIGLMEDALRGKATGSDRIMAMAEDSTEPDVIRSLCDKISRLLVQGDVHEYRIELMLEDLMSTQQALDQAHHDPLTGLRNRAEFHKQLSSHLPPLGPHGQPLALMLIDLDHFKQVNDTYGHDAGDEVLVQATRRMMQALPDASMLFRIGGDEFTALVLNATDLSEVTHIAQRMTREVASPMALSAAEVHVGCSVGISIFPKDAQSMSALLKKADLAMYAAKSAGRNQHAFYSTP
jgi:diguanylate cyclase